MTSHSTSISTLSSPSNYSRKNVGLGMIGRVLFNQKKIIFVLDDIKKGERSPIQLSQKHMQGLAGSTLVKRRRGAEKKITSRLHNHIGLERKNLRL